MVPEKRTGIWVPDEYVADFVARSIVRNFSQWKQAVRQRHPDVLFAIGSSLYPCFDRQMQITDELLQISDTSSRPDRFRLVWTGKKDLASAWQLRGNLLLADSEGYDVARQGIQAFITEMLAPTRKGV